jgi:two-component system, response regulator PdtaR
MIDTDKPTVVLLVEDEALVRMVGADILEEAGFRVIEAVNANEALAMLEARTDVQALVTDVEMPGGLDGFTLARLVHKAWPHIRIVVASGRASPAEGVMPPRAFFLPKPYKPDALVRAVQSRLAPRPQPIVLGPETKVRASAPTLPRAPT